MGGDETMDENVKKIIEENGDEPMIKTEIDIEDVEQDIATEEVVTEVIVEQEETPVIDISESMGWVGGDYRYHDSLLGIDLPRQHPITAITGLREELDEIEKLKTEYSDSINIANYYKWKDATYDIYGYFVSLVPGDTTIQLCAGDDVFGVAVERAGFVGNQNDIQRDNSYGLIVTSGLVDVRCELNVQTGDYVVCNEQGYAKKAESNYGYKVLSIETKSGTKYAVIALGVQADVTNAIGIDVQNITERVRVNEQNIVSAMNTANQAYQKSSEAAESSSVSKEAVEEALKDILGFGEKLDEMEKTVASSSVISAQAKALADSAAVSAESMRNEAVEKAENAWDSTENLIKTLEPITSWKDKDSGVSGVDYLATQMNNGIATTYDIKVVDEKTEKSMNAIIRNAKESQSLMTNIDKYSVGEYSQANGLTLEQTQNILEIGMIYVPTSHSGTQYHKEEYAYEANGKTETYTRWFVPGYLYRWDKISEGQIGWLTIGNNDKVVTEEDPSKLLINTASQWVFFSHIEPAMNDEWEYGYWYTNGDNIVSTTGIYAPYTLYKWEKPEGENGYWLAVATLAGNVNNRATSLIRQTANEVASELTNARGSATSLSQRLDNTQAEVDSLVAWKDSGGATNEAIIRQVGNDKSASIVISALRRDADDNVTGQASLTLMTSSDNDSALVIDANHINFEAEDYQVRADRINFDAGDYTIKADKVDFSAGDYTINANRIKFQASDVSGQNILLDTDGSQTVSVYMGSPSEVYYYKKYNIETEPLSSGVNYVFSADISFAYNAPTYMYVVFYNNNNKTTTQRFDIIDGHISGVLTPSSDVYGPLVIYNKFPGSPTDNYCTLSNVKLEEEKYANAIPTEWGVIEFKSHQLTIDTEYFKLDEFGRIKSTGGDIAGWTLNKDTIYGLYNAVRRVEPITIGSCTGTDAYVNNQTFTISPGNTYYYSWYQIPTGCKKVTVRYNHPIGSQQEFSLLEAMNMTSNKNGYYTFESEDISIAPLPSDYYTFAPRANTQYIICRIKINIQDTNFLNDHGISTSVFAEEDTTTGLYIGSVHKKTSLIDSSTQSPIRFYVGEEEKNAFSVLADGSTYCTSISAKGLFQTFDDNTAPHYPACHINSLGNTVMFEPHYTCSWIGGNNTVPSGFGTDDSLYVGWNLSLYDISNPKLIARPTLYNKTKNAWYRSTQYVTLAEITSPASLWTNLVATISEGATTEGINAESSMGGAWSSNDFDYVLN